MKYVNQDIRCIKEQLLSSKLFLSYRLLYDPLDSMNLRERFMLNELLYCELISGSSNV